MDLNFNPAWIAAGGALAFVGAFWEKFKAFAGQISKIMIVSANLDSATSTDVVRYLRAHYRYIKFSEINIRSVHKTRLDNGMSIWVPFETPNCDGFYKGPHGTVWMKGWSSCITLKALRGTFDFKALISAANDFDNKLRYDDRPDRFYIQKVLGSEKGAWALGEALRERPRGESTQSPSSVGSGDSKLGRESDIPMPIRVHEDIDVSFKYDRSEYTRSGRTDPFKGLFFTEEVLKEVDDARTWMNMGKWYAERHIPHRRGLMIHGPGGTGKSSFVKALAESLGIPVYQYFLNTLSDQEFIREWSAMATPCVALLEDFDNVFHGREAQTEHKSLSFDCVLNQISGVSSLNGVYLVVTTNCIDKIDAAMGISKEGTEGISTRPGRVDRVIYMGAAPAKQRQMIASHILRDWPERVNEVVEKGEGMTPSQVQEMCTQIAYEKLSERQAT